MTRFVGFAGLLLPVVVLVRCSAAGGDSPSGGSGASRTDAGTDVLNAGGAGGDGGGITDGGPVQEGSTSPPIGEVYAHSDDTLYKLEPISKTVTVVGKFDCLGDSNMWDIALDKVGSMFGSANGISGGSLVRIDKTTAHCDVMVSANSLPNSLAFVPAGTLDPTEEVLVGFDRSSYVRIDQGTGQVHDIGSLNPNPTGEQWESSGDIVSIIDDGTYATVKPYLAGSSYGTDTIVEIDPVTGQALHEIGDTGFYGLWGLGYWGGVAYGFSEGGQLCQIDLSTGAGVGIPIPNLSTDLSFGGAGVTTAAPIEMPK